MLTDWAEVQLKKNVAAQNSLVLSDENAADFEQVIFDMMNCCHHHHGGAGNYTCKFCGNTSDATTGLVTHAKDCKGVKFLELLKAK